MIEWRQKIVFVVVLVFISFLLLRRLFSNNFEVSRCESVVLEILLPLYLISVYSRIACSLVFAPLCLISPTSFFLFYFFSSFYILCALCLCVHCALNAVRSFMIDFFIVGCMALAATQTTLWWCGKHCVSAPSLYIHGTGHTVSSYVCIDASVHVRLCVCKLYINRGIFREYMRWSARSIEFIKHVIGSSYASHVSFVVCVLLKY